MVFFARDVECVRANSAQVSLSLAFRSFWYISEKLSGFYSYSIGSVVFPRINVKDPYKRLGISRMASEDEIQGARNFLIHHYAAHKPSVDAFESAHDKIIMHKFHQRKKHPKIDLTKKVRELRQSKAVNFFFDRFQTPAHCFPCQNGCHLCSSRCSHGDSYVLLDPPKDEEEEALVFPLRVIIIANAFANLLDFWISNSEHCDETGVDLSSSRG